MVSTDDNTDSHNETLTSHQLTPGLSRVGPNGDELVNLLSLLRLQPDAQLLLGQFLSGNSSGSSGTELMTPLTNELHAALLDSSKSCFSLACPLIAHLCNTVRNSFTTDGSNKTAEFCAAALLELIPSVAVATFLYGSTSRSLLETTATTTMPISSLHQPQQPNLGVSTTLSSSVPPSPIVSTFQAGPLPQPPSSPSTSLRQVLSTLTAQPSGIVGQTQHMSPEYLLQFVLSLIANGTMISLATSLNQPPPRSATTTLNVPPARPTSASSSTGRAATPNSPPLSSSNMPGIHHFASLVAPSVYHNPVLFGAAVISDSAQTEHHQHERRVRIPTIQSAVPVSSIIANFKPNTTVPLPLQPGMVAPLAMAALAEFNRHYAVQLTGGGSNVGAVMRCCDAALRLLCLPISSPSLQSVSPGIALQFVYFASIASTGTSKMSSSTNATLSPSNSDGISSLSQVKQFVVTTAAVERPSIRTCRKYSTSTSGMPSQNKDKLKQAGVSFDVENTIYADYKYDDSSSDEEDGITDEKQLCRLKLLQVLHAARNLAELRLWPDVLAVVKAVKNTSGLDLDLGEGAEGAIELALSQPTSVRAITNASFKARKLPDDIEATVDQKEMPSPAPKHAHGHHTLPSDSTQQQDSEVGGTSSGKRGGHHHRHHIALSAANQFTSHWRAGKHSAAIASLQAAFRLPERLRSRRRSFGPEVGMSTNVSTQSNVAPSNQAPTPATTSGQRGSSAAVTFANIPPAPSFSIDRDSTSNTPIGPRLEMRILDNPTLSSSSNPVDGIEETSIDERHQNLPMIDDAKTGNGSSDNNNKDNTPRSRTNSIGQQQQQQQHQQRPSIIQSALGSITRSGRS